MRSGTTLAATIGLAALLTAAPASAVPITVVLGDGFSKDNPADFPNDLTSSLGSSLAGSVIGFDPDTGIFSANIVNAGEGVVTGVAFKLNDSLFNNQYASADFSMDLTNCPSCVFSASGLPNPAVEDGFGDFSIGATASPPPSGNGIPGSQEASFFWDFSGLGLDFSGVTSMLDVVAFNTVEIEDPDGLLDPVFIDAFWVAMVQVLGPDGEDSDHIGGQFTVVVPEPGTVALIGVGLLALGMLRRRRWQM